MMTGMAMAADVPPIHVRYQAFVSRIDLCFSIPAARNRATLSAASLLKTHCDDPDDGCDDDDRRVRDRDLLLLLIYYLTTLICYFRYLRSLAFIYVIWMQSDLATCFENDGASSTLS